MIDERLARLGAHVAAEQDGLPAAEPDEATRRFLAEHAARRAAGPRASESGRNEAGPRALARRHGPRLLLAALLLGVVLALKGAWFDPAPLSFSLGAQAQPGVLERWALAPDDARLPIQFSDGTLIELEPRARARVVSLGPSGAEVVIDAGVAHVAVVPARTRLLGGSPWLLRLGPFAVEVKGTRFDVAWAPSADTFALDLFEGSVVVSGCEPGQSHTLVAGQSVRASCAQRRWSVMPLARALERDAAPARPALDEPANDAPPVAAPGPRLASPAADAGSESAPRAAPGSAAARSWQRLARAGHYSAAYTAALDVGIERLCARGSASDLVLLGDTARLAGDASRARRAYEAARQRFPGSAAAASAAFGLGRLEVNANPDGGARWFELYLREQPAGPFAASAADRSFELAVTSGDPRRLRSAADAYLQRQPQGAHARDARRILDAAPTP